MQTIVANIQLLNESLKKKYSGYAFQRNLFYDVQRNFPCIGIVGERGVGKTTLLFQKMLADQQGIYISCDMEYIKELGLFALIIFLYKELNETTFYLDEIHEYPHRQKELKNILDSFADIKIIFSGSSSTKLSYAGADLSRRALIYTLWPLNFQEYLHLFHNISFPRIDFATCMSSYKEISFRYADQVKQSYIIDFLLRGSYPYTLGLQREEYTLLILNALKKVSINDVLFYSKIESQTLLKLQQTFTFMAQSTPSEINYTNLARKIGVDPKNLSGFLDILAQIGVVNLVSKDFQLSNKLRKEKKIYFGNGSLLYAISRYQGITPHVGTLRETAVIDLIRRISSGEYIVPKQGDIAFHRQQNTYLFEIGGKNKSTQQINSSDNAYLLQDNIYIGTGKTLPLRLFLCIG